MCVILVKEKGIELPTKKVLKCCWERNPDGAIFAFCVLQFIIDTSLF